jgi:WhiB family redox-sensing transcriptional regulator
MTWYDDAAGRSENLELFFPIGETGPALRQLTRAKRVCAGCPVRSRCLEWGHPGQH